MSNGGPSCTIGCNNLDNITYHTNHNKHAYEWATRFSCYKFDKTTINTNLQASWVCSKSIWNLLFHRSVLFKHKCHALFKHKNNVHDFLV